MQQRSLQALRRLAAQGPADFLAERACAAAVSLLDVDGASLAASYSPTMSVPVGASDAVAAAAEQAQFTAGEGPCLYAQNTGVLSVISDLADAEDAGRLRWPTYALLLARVADYRSVWSVPVPPPSPSGASTRGGAPWGVPVVLTCYRRRPLFTADATAVRAASAVGAALADALGFSAALGLVLNEVGGAQPDPTPRAAPGPELPAEPVPVWLASLTALGRAVVWQAEEVLLLADEGLSREGALAALRTYAVIHSLNIDQAARELVQGRLDADEVRGRR